MSEKLIVFFIYSVSSIADQVVVVLDKERTNLVELTVDAGSTLTIVGEIP